MQKVKDCYSILENNVNKVIFGKEDVIRYLFAAFLCKGHVLMEDVPGTGKTILARSFSQSIGFDFKRVQFTPDILPTDLTGLNVFNQKNGDFNFYKGPIFTDFLLADEINRASPRTQSALLEAMAEYQVTIEGKKYALSPYFFVLATQNPVEYEGTFPLPEAQLDRFLIKISMGYPDIDSEIKMMQSQSNVHPIDNCEPVLNREDIFECMELIKKVKMDVTIEKFIIGIVRQTREDNLLSLGASPRGTLALMKISKALAAIDGRDFVLPDDVKQSVKKVLSHRLLLSPESKLRQIDVGQILNNILEKTVPEIINE